jgi:hypothetical protein
VLERLPKTEAAQTKAVMMAAYKLEPKQGIAKDEQAGRVAAARSRGCGGLAARRAARDMKYSSAMFRPPATAKALSATKSLLCIRWLTRSNSLMVSGVSEGAILEVGEYS